MNDLEPLNEEPYSYRKAALGYLQTLLAVDAYMARSKDGVIAWVSIAIVLRLHSVKRIDHGKYRQSTRLYRIAVGTQL